MKINSGLGKVFFSIAGLVAVISAVRASHGDELHTRSWTLENTVNTFDPALAESTRAGSQFWFVDKQALDGRTLKLSVVAPGNATHPPHAHTEDEFFFILEGSAEFHLNGDSTRVGPLTSLYCPPDSFHGIRNVGNTDLKYLVIKKYILEEAH